MTFSELPIIPQVPGKEGWPWQIQHNNLLSVTIENTLPKISIITPSYNQGQYLEETIRSVILQNYPNYELIVIDAGSGDNTLEIIKKYEPWITYWVSEKDRGQSHAICKGLNVATGDIINWINSDDLCAPGAFYRIAAEFNIDKYDVICGYCNYFIDNIHNLSLINERMGVSDSIADIFIKVKINQPSTFFKACVFKELGVDEQFRYTMDVDLWYRYLLIAGKSKILVSDSLFTYFRLHDQSKSVAEIDHFKGDIYRVYYNILYSLKASETLLKFVSLSIPKFDNFKPKRYYIQIATKETREFVRYMSWLAINYYNEVRDYDAAKECLNFAVQQGQSFDIATLKQLIKHYIFPKRFL